MLENGPLRVYQKTADKPAQKGSYIQAVLKGHIWTATKWGVQTVSAKAIQRGGLCALKVSQRNLKGEGYKRRGHSRKSNGSEAKDQMKQPKTLGGSSLAEKSGQVSHWRKAPEMCLERHRPWRTLKAILTLYKGNGKYPLNMWQRHIHRNGN